MLIIGSSAVYRAGISTTKPRDIDVICTYTEWKQLIQLAVGSITHYYKQGTSHCHFMTKDSKMVELELAKEGTTAMSLLDYEKATEGLVYASPSSCLALKLSHRYLKDSPHFLKTMKDIQTLRETVYIREGSFLDNWIKERESVTYNYSHPNLNQSKKGFFEDSIKYVYDHDTLHIAVSYPDVPAYTHYIGEGAEVNCSRALFDKLPHDTKLKGVVEEASVLALERSLIPFPGVGFDRRAFCMALEKVCTSITSGWFREFAWNNYYDALSVYDNDPVLLHEKLKIGLELGIVKPFTESYK